MRGVPKFGFRHHHGGYRALHRRKTCPTSPRSVQMPRHHHGPPLKIQKTAGSISVGRKLIFLSLPLAQLRRRQPTLATDHPDDDEIRLDLLFDLAHRLARVRAGIGYVQLGQVGVDVEQFLRVSWTFRSGSR